MEADKSPQWFTIEKVAKVHLGYSTITGDQSLTAIVQQSKSDTDLVRAVGGLISTKQVRSSLRLRELILLCMGNQRNLEQIGAIDNWYVELCAKDPSVLLEIYCEMLEEFRVVKIDFAYSYSTLIRKVLQVSPFLMENPCFAEVKITENVLVKKLSEIENHYNRVIEQENQCRSHDVSQS